MVNANIFVEDSLRGKCDYCKKFFPIERGDNFAYVEKEKKWKCRECEAEGLV